jgi:rhamnose utilization protein RhaD (predicted bifunctional aldolase and dehydrogenase)/NAD(P)-dependent dehydrogenase (short-subunit alcohol dehydrogenase family)
MRSRWNETEAARAHDALDLRVYSSRLLGADPSLVLHGGGNTSVKIVERNILGDEEEILYVKGSGWDLATIERVGFSPVRMQRLLGLAQLEELSDTRMASELRSNMTETSAPSPSVEAILHALLPFPFVDHTHADAIVTLTNTPHGEGHVREALGDRVVIVPYVMPGFALARLCADMFPRQAHRDTIGMVLLNHGLFTFGETAHESYERTIELVDAAERYLAARGAWTVAERAVQSPEPDTATLAEIRHAVSRAMGAPAITVTHRDSQVLSFLARDDLASVARCGPATPDHVIRTKRLPMLGTDVESYAHEYEAYVERNRSRSNQPITPLDPAPRVVLDPAIGLVTVGRMVKDARVAEDIYRHTIEIIERAEMLDKYQALPEGDIFDVEYWELEQAKLRTGGSSPPLTGEIALVTGAASGIGKATAEALAAAGAAVAVLDIAPTIEDAFTRPEILPIRCDVTNAGAVQHALRETVLAFGGLDMLVLNAGIFPGGTRIADLPQEEWERVMHVNVDANLALMRAAHPLLCRSPRGGRVVVIGSKNVPAPGPGAAAYSASKAALTQLARVAALEWGRDGIRVNVLHPNAVFDTGIWTEEVLAARARHYGLTVDQYKRNNVLGVEVTSRDVASLAVALCTDLFARTTGAQIPVDGGNERVI